MLVFISIVSKEVSVFVVYLGLGGGYGVAGFRLGFNRGMDFGI